MSVVAPLFGARVRALVLLGLLAFWPAAWACLGSGSLLECGAPRIIRYNPDQPADAQEWQYGTCRQGGSDNCPFWAVNCCAAGGIWSGGGAPVNCGGMHCTGLPHGT